MAYTLGFKEKWIRMALEKGEKTFCSIATEAGIPEQRLRDWIKLTRKGKLAGRSEQIESKRTSRDILKLIIGFQAVSVEKQGESLRMKGLHSETLTQYEQEISDLVENKAREDKKTITERRKENKNLERELRRNEKALAEMAALYILQKKRL